MKFQEAVHAIRLRRDITGITAKELGKDLSAKWGISPSTATSYISKNIESYSGWNFHSHPNNGNSRANQSRDLNTLVERTLDYFDALKVPESDQIRIFKRLSRCNSRIQYKTGQERSMNSMEGLGDFAW